VGKNRSYWNSLSFRLSLAFLVVSAAGIALAAILAYRAGNSQLNTFINQMGGMGGMMGQPVKQARQNYLNGISGYLWAGGAAGVVLSLVLGWVFSRQIAQPLDSIAEAAHKVEEGNLEQKIETKGYREVQDLGTSFNNMAATLRQDRDLRRNMIADIAHELRTPISVLQGNIEGIIDGVLSDNRETLEILHGETLELARLVEDLRTLSLAETGQLKFDFQPVDLGKLSMRVVESFKAVAAARGIKLDAVIPPGNLTVRADADRTAQVLRALIDNAMKYSPADRKIEVRVAAGNGNAAVSVTDQGQGISAENLPMVFERFYRVDPSRSRSTGGSGLGLAIAKQLIEAQGGRIGAESKLGDGSTFTFNLPLAKTVK
jgi:two-component system, OmpR family, sensor histidine kinase BaeS